MATTATRATVVRRQVGLFPGDCTRVLKATWELQGPTADPTPRGAWLALEQARLTAQGCCERGRRSGEGVGVLMSSVLVRAQPMALTSGWPGG